jgi:hypothetical protein
VHLFAARVAPAWLVAVSVLLTGCAMFEAQPPSTTRLDRQRTRVSQKESASAPGRTKSELARSFRNTSTSIRTIVRGGKKEGGCGTVDQCALLLRQMVDDPNRTWIAKRVSPTVYANGTRLFAYRALRRNLSCSQLVLALEETQAATISLNDPPKSLTGEELTRVRALNAEVKGELRSEQAQRCAD